MTLDKLTKEHCIRGAVIAMIFGIVVLGYPYYEPLPRITAYLVAQLLSVFIGSSPAVSDNVVLLSINDGLAAINISTECSGFIVLLLFEFVMFLTPRIELKHRFYSLIFIPVIYLANIIRIASAVVIGEISNIDTMMIYHNSMGQIIFFAMLIISYIAFLYIFGYLKVEKPILLK